MRGGAMCIWEEGNVYDKGALYLCICVCERVW